MLGSIVATFTLQDNSCLVPKGAGALGVLTAAEETAAAGMTYSMENVRFSIDCYSVAGGFYEAMLEERLQEAPIAINYLETYSFQQDNQTGGSAQARFSLATRCLGPNFRGK